ncbi:hypothetical protein ACWGDS_37755 [Streptomyces sp. NPDC055059]
MRWLTGDAALAETASWRRDPLDNTLARLATSVDEDKPSTALATTSVHTIIDVLNQADLTSEEALLLAAVVQHLREWETNPANVSARLYGTGIAYRAQALATTASPTLLSLRGGPFFLHATATRKSDKQEALEDMAVGTD